MLRYKVVATIALLASSFLLVLPRIIPVCTGLTPAGEPMRCHYAFQSEFFIALLAVIISLGLFVIKTYEARALSGLLLGLLGAIVIILPQPWAIGICEPSGICHKTAYFGSIAGSVLILAAAAAIVISHKIQGSSKQ